MRISLFNFSLGPKSCGLHPLGHENPYKVGGREHKGMPQRSNILKTVYHSLATNLTSGNITYERIMFEFLLLCINA